VITDDGRGRSVYERRVYRQRDRNSHPSMRPWQRVEEDD
jgi:hypothetical protein